MSDRYVIVYRYPGGDVAYGYRLSRHDSDRCLSAFKTSRVPPAYRIRIREKAPLGAKQAARKFFDQGLLKAQSYRGRMISA